MNINHQVDSYSMLIVSKYLETKQEFINIMCVNSKFKETTEKLRLNPIPITSLKLFPKIQTQYLYSKDDIMINGIDNYEILYEIDYQTYLQINQTNIKCKHIKYTKQNMLSYGNNIPLMVSSISNRCFYQWKLNSITIPTTITSIGIRAFFGCNYLSNIQLPNTLIDMGVRCFHGCSITSINLPTLISTIKKNCFKYCDKLQSINIPTSVTSIGDSCFGYCSSLQSIRIPTSIKTIGNYCFYECKQLSNVQYPKHTLIGVCCFVGCEKLNNKT